MNHTVRTKDYGETKKVVEIDHYTRARFCTECMGFEEHPRNCTAKLCPLFPFRGKVLDAYVDGTEL